MLKQQKRFQIARVRLRVALVPKIPPDQELFDPRKTLCRDERLRASTCGCVFTCPDYTAFRRRLRQPPASALALQTGPSACVALPAGWIGHLKVEGDNQFFLSSSVS